MKKRRSDYFQKMAVRHSSQGADDDPGVMPKLRLDFNRKEQGALMKYAQRVRSLYKCVLLSACCACASAHHALTHSHAYSLTRSLAPPHLLAHSSLSFRCVGVLAAAREQRVHGSRCHARRRRCAGGTADEKIASKCDNNETVSKRLMAMVESRNLVDTVRDAGSWDTFSSRHSEVWKGDDGSQLMEVAINLNAKTKSPKSTGS